MRSVAGAYVSHLQACRLLCVGLHHCYRAPVAPANSSMPTAQLSPNHVPPSVRIRGAESNFVLAAAAAKKGKRKEKRKKEKINKKGGERRAELGRFLRVAERVLGLRKAGRPNQRGNLSEERRDEK
ncbi:hypothetical protein TIFTF001_013945 [Ficus carica]|uniref:Uncharacterized protein n=1 Tax=Ficus carica TaxID=3494 RepID=A0AA88A2V6_FICCA|nr:hypothetical protein TIFTF001_013945 [Ficus carica]